MVIVHSNRAALGLSIPGRLGARIPMLATGVGLVTLAWMPEDERRAALARIQDSGDRWDSDPRLVKDLPQRLDQIRRQNHAFADEEYLDAVYQSRIWAVAVPIRIEHSQLRVALSSLVLRIGGERKRLLRTILPNLSRAAERIGRLLTEDYI
jgi:IclR family transcriptional regulator, mhp operon transcriptional activator